MKHGHLFLTFDSWSKWFSPNSRKEKYIKNGNNKETMKTSQWNEKLTLLKSRGDIINPINTSSQLHTTLSVLVPKGHYVGTSENTFEVWGIKGVDFKETITPSLDLPK